MGPESLAKKWVVEGHAELVAGRARGSQQMSENIGSVGSMRSLWGSDVFCSVTEVELDFLRFDRFGGIRGQGERGCAVDTNIVIFRDLVHGIKLRTSGGGDPGNIGEYLHPVHPSISPQCSRRSILQAQK